MDQSLHLPSKIEVQIWGIIFFKKSRLLSSTLAKVLPFLKKLH